MNATDTNGSLASRNSYGAATTRGGSISQGLLGLSANP